MATLTVDELSLEVRLSDFANGWVYYEIYFRWRGDNVVQDSVLKRDGSSYWESRPPGALLASEMDGDGLAPLIRRVLESNEPDWWEPTDPDVLVAIYPEQFFPFLPPRHERVERQGQGANPAEGDAPIRSAKPDDLLTVVLLVDAYNFKGADAYTGHGLSLQLIAKREELEAFAQALEAEWQALRALSP